MKASDPPVMPTGPESRGGFDAPAASVFDAEPTALPLQRQQVVSPDSQQCEAEATQRSECLERLSKTNPRVRMKVEMMLNMEVGGLLRDTSIPTDVLERAEQQIAAMGDHRDAFDMYGFNREGDLQ